MKRFLCVFLSTVILIISISTSVFADIPDTAPNIPDGYRDFKDYLWQIVKDVGYIGVLPAVGLSELVKQVLNSKGMTGEAEQINSDNQAANWLIQNGINVNGNGNTVITGNSLQFVKDLIDYEINQNQLRYYYSGDINGQPSQFFSAGQYTAVKNLIEENQINYYINCYSYGREIYLFLYSKSYVGFVLNYSNRKVIIDKSTWQPVYYSSIGNKAKCYKVTEAGSLTGLDISYITDEWNGNLNNNGNLFFRSGDRVKQIVTSGYVEMFPTYTILSGLQSETVGEYPYFINSPVYNSFKSSSGDYTITTDNSNKTTYGDVTTYIDDHHTETGDYPTLPEINVFIENYIPPSPTPTPVPTGVPDDGGSGTGSFVNNNNPVFNNNPNININLLPNLSGNTVSGNGSGSSGGIFDWISSIGGVIGDFIKNVGQLLADVIKGISETITTVLSSIPNLLSGIVEFVYGGLPDELKALVTLGLTAVVLVSVIKILRK